VAPARETMIDVGCRPLGLRGFQCQGRG
jgi:hypothetical protein